MDDILMLGGGAEGRYEQDTLYMCVGGKAKLILQTLIHSMVCVRKDQRQKGSGKRERGEPRGTETKRRGERLAFKKNLAIWNISVLPAFLYIVRVNRSFSVGTCRLPRDSNSTRGWILVAKRRLQNEQLSAQCQCQLISSHPCTKELSGLDLLIRL